MPGPALTLTEREEIRVGIDRGDNDTRIAQTIDRHPGTVGSEIKRNGGRSEYRAVRAQARADQCRRRPKPSKLGSDPTLAAHVTARLKAKDSPMTISIELARGVHGIQASISHECLYQAIHQPDRGLERGLYRGLHLPRRCRKHRGQQRRDSNSLGDYKSIHDRPAMAGRRFQIGNLEGDLIVGARNQSAIITVFDRTSRNLWLGRVDNKTADAVRDALIALLRRIPARHRRTLTWDQGAEIARHLEIEQACNIDIYIADPKSPWQRPTNENGNALVRRYVGKGTDLSEFTTRQLRAIERRINTMPRRSLHWHTANDIYTAVIALTS